MGFLMDSWYMVMSNTLRKLQVGDTHPPGGETPPTADFIAMVSPLEKIRRQVCCYGFLGGFCTYKDEFFHASHGNS